eukprot:gene21610-53124_t
MSEYARLSPVAAAVEQHTDSSREVRAVLLADRGCPCVLDLSQGRADGFAHAAGRAVRAPDITTECRRLGDCLADCKDTYTKPVQDVTDYAQRDARIAALNRLGLAPDLGWWEEFVDAVAGGLIDNVCDAIGAVTVQLLCTFAVRKYSGIGLISTAPIVPNLDSPTLLEPATACQGGAGVDCGGSCDLCSSCYDGERNGDEERADCGGSCAERCATCASGARDGDEDG